jgi:type II secretory pathway component PulF
MDTEAKIFHFKATAPEGGTTTGRIDASSKAEAMAKLSARGFRPLRLSEGNIQESFWHRELVWGRRLSIAGCQSFCGEMGVLVAAGMEVVDALGVLIESLPKPSRIHRLCQSTRQSVRLGHPFSTALRLSGFAFPPDFLTLIAVGEDTASLDKTLAALARSYREKLEFEKVLIGAVSYPILLLFVACLVILLLTLFVAPNLAALFQSLDRPVPVVVGIMMSTSQFLQNNIAVLAPILGIAIGLIIISLRIKSVRESLRYGLFRSPVLGEGLKWSSTQRLASTLQLHLARQSPFSVAVPSALIASGFPGATKLAAESAALIRQGKGLSQVLAAVRLIPAKAVRIIAVGEAGGRLNDVLEIVAQEARLSFERRMTLFSSLLSPVLILVVGVLVGSMIFGVFSALMDINAVAF